MSDSGGSDRTARVLTPESRDLFQRRPKVVLTVLERRQVLYAKAAAQEAVAFLDGHRARLDDRYWTGRSDGRIRTGPEETPVCPLSACADEGVLPGECEPETAIRELDLSLDSARLITKAADDFCLYDHCDERGLDNPEPWEVDAFDRVRKALEDLLRNREWG